MSPPSPSVSAPLAPHRGERAGERGAHPGSWPVSRSLAHRRLPMNRTPVVAGVPPAVEGGVPPPGTSGLHTRFPPGKMPGSTAGETPAATDSGRPAPTGSWPVSRSFLTRWLPMNLKPNWDTDLPASPSPHPSPEGEGVAYHPKRLGDPLPFELLKPFPANLMSNLRSPRSVFSLSPRRGERAGERGAHPGSWPHCTHPFRSPSP